MRVAREQMLCIISPKWTTGLTALCPNALDQLFTDIGVVHFASAALLPARSGAPAGALPSLMLELAVDEGVRPTDLLARLSYHPTGALTALYGSYLKINPTLSAGERAKHVLTHLASVLSVADGGFIGPRDRSVSQVRQELVLLDRARAHAPLLPPAVRTARRPFALALSQWSRAQAQLPVGPAPRSFWRKHANGAKIVLLLMLIAAPFAAAWLVGLASAALQAPWHWLALKVAAPPSIETWATLHLQEVSNAAMGFAAAGRRLGLASALTTGTAAVYALGSLLLGRLRAPWDAWFAAIGRELDRPTDAWSARATHAFMWLVVTALAIPLALLSGYVVADRQGLAQMWTWLRSDHPDWVGVLLAVHAVLALALLVLLVMGLRSALASLANPADGFLRARLKAFRRFFHQPSEPDTPRAQQVHASLERSEAALVGTTAHLISLTELRRPYAWSAWWTRLSLRVVTAIGYAFFTEGRLGTAPGIQFSHWHIIDRGRRLLFCANFDGTFGGYLDDFIKGPSIGTTLFWRWSELLPRPAALPGQPAVAQRRPFAPTRLVVYRGVRCELKFKAYARESMLPHVYRFDAANRTLEQKARATALRDALCGERTDAADDLIMRAIET
jgi:hypothetical protein